MDLKQDAVSGLHLGKDEVLYDPLEQLTTPGDHLNQQRFCSRFAAWNLAFCKDLDRKTSVSKQFTACHEMLEEFAGI